MKKGTKNRLLALLCAFVLCFCDVGIVLAENNVTLPVAEENEDGVVLPDDDLTEYPDDGTTETPDDGTTETPDDGTTEEPEQPEHTHVYVETITKEPTYTEKGEKTFTCECGDSYTEEIPMLEVEEKFDTTAENKEDGISLNWVQVEGAAYYELFKGTTEESKELYEAFVKVEATETTYIDIAVESGITYYYVIKAYDVANEVLAESEVTMMYLEQPTIDGFYTDESLEISWPEVAGATHYIVERRNTKTDWEVIDTTENNRFIDHIFIIGNVYSYRVYAVAQGEVESYRSAYSNSKSFSWEDLEGPKQFIVSNEGYKRVSLTWLEVIGADGYQIYRSKKNEKGTFKKVATVTDTQYGDTSVVTDTKYYYKVRAIAGDEKGQFSEVKSVTPKVLKPKVKTKISATSSSIQITWLKSADADGYYVYRKRKDGEWKRIATIKDPKTLTYKDKDVSGRYVYSVRAYKKVGDKTYTSYRSTEMDARTLGKVKLSGIKQQGESRVVTVSWNKVSYATGYQVYKKVGKNGSWKYVNTTDADTRSYSAEIPQGKYVYWKVRAIRTLGKMTTQAAFSDSKSFIFANPKFDYELSENYGSSVRTIKFTVYNTSKANLRFYSQDAMILDEDNESNNRTLQLVDSNGNNLKYVNVKAGAQKTLTFKIVGKKTKYNEDSVIGIIFKFDGLKYLFATYAGSPYGAYGLIEE